MSISFRDKILHIDKVLGGVPGLFSRNSAGLVPQAPSGNGTTKFLREDRAWADAAPAQMIAPVESTSTASRAYAIGEQFVYNGILTEATAAISQGATITVGNSGNAKLADCVMDQVIQLKDALNDLGTMDTLKSFSNSTADTLTLNYNLNNYRFIIIDVMNTAGGVFSSQIAHHDEFVLHSTPSNPYSLWVWDGASWSNVYIKVVSNTQVEASVTSGKVVSIRGIK